MLSKQVPLGIYEKALPGGECWLERLQLAKELGFDFVEMSVDETDARLARLDWNREQRLALVAAIADTGIRVPSMCLSAHRRFPLGSEDDAVREQGLEIMRKAIQFAQDIGIRVIQMAGYDVYYQQANNETRRRFRDGLKESVEMASRAQVTLEGVVDFERCFATLKQSGYCGPYLIEMWSETSDDPAREVAKARDWVKARMASAGLVEAV
ncbi:L-ribulose-5-phosphate 3-epimerase [Citrobacter freundii]|uniref:L-ribulose-5-phosphate 3-epimerase n=1 Tax=Citrobacter freundii TaxID=546 RepID=UPI00350F45AA